jgi:hypothetical protein
LFNNNNRYYHYNNRLVDKNNHYYQLNPAIHPSLAALTARNQRSWGYYFD